MKLILLIFAVLTGCAANDPLSAEWQTATVQKNIRAQCEYETDGMEPKYTQCLHAKGL